MNWFEVLDRNIFILLTIIHSFQISNTDGGAPSTPKNLVNLYTHSPNDSSNITNTNAHQNEYQYHQSASKSATSDRNKSTTPSETLSDHSSSSDMSTTGALDYTYQDVRVTTNVPDCRGRLKLNHTRGYITDGPGHYPPNLQCVWLIDGGHSNATVRIQFRQFNLECNYDYLYIFDGDSIYSPLVAALSGDLRDFSAALMETYRNERLISAYANQTISNSSASSLSFSPSGSTVLLATSDMFEVKTNSGKAFIYFHSDTAHSMPGFYLTYSIDSCALDCSNRGDCDYSTLKCKCHPGYYGEGCQHTLCPNNCTSPLHGSCDKSLSCLCNDGFYGQDCSNSDDQQVWVQKIRAGELRAPPRAFHQAVVVDNFMWIIGGRTQVSSNTNLGIFRQNKTRMVYKYDLDERVWDENFMEGTTGIDHLAELAGHSVATDGHKLFIYGGMAMNNSILRALSVIDTRTNSLVTLSPENVPKADDEFVAPIATAGHTANIVGSHMYIFLGYNPRYGYIDFVQKFNLADNSWTFVAKKGSSISGRIGHTSTYDPVDKLVYIYGGYNAKHQTNLYSFDPYSEIWKLILPGSSPRYYHSALIVSRQLIILGGNNYQYSDQCFEQTYLVYDLPCSKALSESYSSNHSESTCRHHCWSTIEKPGSEVLKRHGHSVVSHNNTLILFGGFNGILMNDLRFLTIGHCHKDLHASDCSEKKLALDCYWDVTDSECKNWNIGRDTSSISHHNTGHNCTKTEIRLLQNVCEARDTCKDCLNVNVGCVWCGLSRCQYGHCKSPEEKITTEKSSCQTTWGQHPDRIPINWDLEDGVDCKRHVNCHQCHLWMKCTWQNDSCSYSPSSVLPWPAQDESIGTSSIKTITDEHSSENSTGIIQHVDPITRSLPSVFQDTFFAPSYHPCDNPCYMRRSCNECTTSKCIWCSTTEQCIDSSAYFVYHTMGQCMHYVAHMFKCPVAACADIDTCDKCLTNPRCGWLNDITNTGKGECIEGTSAGPSLTGIAKTNTSLSNPSTPPSWYYTNCPPCQCNGHSHCEPNGKVCLKPCQDHTEGIHCDRCRPGFYGDPVNGGKCRRCECNGNALKCNKETGKCYCDTKGIIGHNCDRCDDLNHYTGDAPNGTCFYNLTTDFQFTFNMSKPEDHFYSNINFINVPLRKDSDVDFTIACSRLAIVSISSGTSYWKRKPIHTDLECGSFRLRFGHDRYSLSETNYSFFVRVYNFQTPFILQIAFSQHRTLYLPQFFFTFSG